MNKVCEFLFVNNHRVRQRSEELRHSDRRRTPATGRGCGHLATPPKEREDSKFGKSELKEPKAARTPTKNAGAIRGRDRDSDR
jgi:hypothetical protein